MSRHKILGRLWRSNQKLSCETDVRVFLYLLLTATSPKIIDVRVNEFDNIEY